MILACEWTKFVVAILFKSRNFIFADSIFSCWMFLPIKFVIKFISSICCSFSGSVEICSKQFEASLRSMPHRNLLDHYVEWVESLFGEIRRIFGKIDVFCAKLAYIGQSWRILRKFGTFLGKFDTFGITNRHLNLDIIHFSVSLRIVLICNSSNFITNE